MKIVNCSLYDSDEKYDVVRSDSCRVLSCKRLDNSSMICLNSYCLKFYHTLLLIDSPVPVRIVL